MQQPGRRMAGKLLLLALAAVGMLNFVFSPTNFLLTCIDNSGAWKLKVMGVMGKGRTPNIREIFPGDMVVCVGRTGGAKNKVMRAIVVRTRKTTMSRLKNGMWSSFDMNAAVVVDTYGNPVGSRILGRIDQRAAVIWPKLAQIARE
ncbi:unnamed protein product [Polarella glacialis]|uniref:50S ribosomal protein L14 n=1 Tax=Polarella glacialis TaxID=89957 RepID=A0A813GVU7_POLGL|nr:unnamed protein product [Polarella glacialis]